MALPQNEIRATRVPFTELIDLAGEKVGGKALVANDEFFAGKENLLKPGRAVFIPGKYDDNGKWMDGWETRRKREPGYDWCIVKLGLPGVIRGVNIDTDHFLGNYPEYCSIEACELEGDPSASDVTGPVIQWTEILRKSRLHGGSQNLFPVSTEKRFTHLRLNIFPDGGVARLRVHGEVRPDWKRLLASKEPVDLAAAENGGIVVACNDSFFGPKDNLILPGRAATMGDGWETQRKRGPGHDWIVVRLGRPGTISKVEVDTNHFKGNFPDRCSIEGCSIREQELLPEDFSRVTFLKWEEILPQTKLKAHTRHYFEAELKARDRAFTHLRLNIYPDGGISRFRAHGVPEK